MDTLKKLASGTMTTVESTLYTAPSATKTIIKEIVLYNADGTNAKNVTIKLDDITIYNKDLQSKETVILKLTSILEATKTIKASGEVNYYISGIEIT